MKVLILQAGFGAGGAEKNVAMIAAHRLARGDEVAVAAMTCPPGGSFFAYPEDVRLHVLREGKRVRGFEAFARLRALRALIRRESPDLIISFLTKINVLALVARLGTGIPVIVAERNNPWAQAAHPLWRHTQDRLAGQAAAIVMQTERARAAMPVAARERCVVIPNPCAPVGPHARRPRADAPHLVAVGRLTPQKGFDLLLTAMARLHAETPQVRLTVFGEGPERQRLLAQRDALGLTSVVAFPGLTSDPCAWISVADLLVVSSRYEGFPNVVAEALVAGIPVVSFDCDFGPRELIDSGQNGLLVPCEDSDALADALLQAIADPALAERAARSAPALREWLSPREVLRAWDDVIDAVWSRDAPYRLNPVSAPKRVRTPIPPGRLPERRDRPQNHRRTHVLEHLNER